MSAERGPVIGLRETTSREERPDGKMDKQPSGHIFSSCWIGSVILAGDSDGSDTSKGRFCGDSTQGGQVRSGRPHRAKKT
jgi:hypothetical protein